MIILLTIFIALFVLYLYSKRNHGYWQKRGIKYEEPIALFGGSLKQYTQKVSFAKRFANLYHQYPNEKFVGFFEGNRQGVLIRDPNLIKHVLATDFRNFHNRGANFHKEITEPLMMNLFHVDGDVWKLTRQKLTPMFSSSKLKAMFPLITERLDTLLKIADGLAQTGKEIDVRELMARYTTDFIGACGFGIDADTMNNEMSEFRKLGKRIFTITKRDSFANITKTVLPELTKHIVNLFAPEIETACIHLVKGIMTQRNYKPIGRNDFIDLLLDLKTKGKIMGESLEKRDKDGNMATVEIEIDDLLLIAQVFVFFAAGFETSSHASSFLLHNLAYHPEIQLRCQKEIDEVLKKHNGKLSFDAVRELKYLEMAMQEALRILPSPAFIMRKNISTYTFPGTELTIDPETIIIISTLGLHNDKKYFEEPDLFRPERFSTDNCEKMKKFVYMPFGDGPRACIGERLGMMQSLAGVAAILSKFTMVPSKNSIRQPKISHKSYVVELVEGGLPLSLRHR